MNKLAIVGGGVTKDLAPFDDTHCDIWTTGSISSILPRADVIFDIHTGDAIQPAEILEKHNCLVWMQEDDAVWNGRRFPIEKLVSKYGRFFNSSMAIMLGWAMYSGYKRIELYGVDMSLTEYPAEYRVNMAYLVGIARGSGIDVIIDGGLFLQPCLTYQYEKPSHIATIIKNKLDETETKLSRVRESIENLQDNEEYLRGAIDATKAMMELYGGN